ncbi:MAG: DNA mismatch repair protein MutL, partial [Planctomycetota bacterium]
RALQHALSEAYRGLLMVGRMPVCFLQMEIDPKTVDVNVHPTKVEVRFEDSGAIYSRLLHTIRHRFLTSNLVAKPRDATIDPQATPIPTPTTGPANTPSMAPASSNTALMDWARSQQSVPDFRPFPSSGFSNDPFRSEPFTPVAPTQQPAWTPSVSPVQNPVALSADPLLDAIDFSPKHSGAQDIMGSARAVGFQIHNRYLITQDEAGMVIIDQHALHERILFEQIKTKVLSKSLDRQRILVPATVQLTSAEAAMALDSKEMLAEIGFEVESFGGDTIVLNAYPSILSKRAPEEMLRQVLEALMSGGKKVNAQDVLDELMNMMACKAAIKAGDRLSDPEITALLEQRHLYHDTHHCPHGRPTALFFSRDQLDKMFKRI